MMVGPKLNFWEVGMRVESGVPSGKVRILRMLNCAKGTVQ